MSEMRTVIFLDPSNKTTMRQMKCRCRFGRLPSYKLKHTIRIYYLGCNGHIAGKFSSLNTATNYYRDVFIFFQFPDRLFQFLRRVVTHPDRVMTTVEILPMVLSFKIFPDESVPNFFWLMTCVLRESF